MSINALHIVYVSPALLSQPSAPVINIIEMCNAFAKKKCLTTLCVPGFWETRDFLFRYYGVEHPFKIVEIDLPGIFHRPGWPGRNLAFALLASNKLRKMGNPQIYTRCPWVFFIMGVLYKKRCFFEAHQFRYVRFMQSSIFHTLVKAGVLFGKGAVVCISETLKKQWENYGIADERLFVAHDAVNPKKFSNSLSKQEARRQLKIDQDIPVVVYTGSLLPGKGADVLIQCANLLPGTSFVIAGGRRPRIDELAELVQHGNVTFAGQVDPARIPLYQAAADVLALPNTKGSVIDDVTSPMKLFEYIASNRPVVATEIPSIMEILVDNHNALLSRPGDSIQLARHVELLTKNPALGESLAKNAMQLLDRFTWDRRARFLTDLIQSESPAVVAAETWQPDINRQ